MFLCSCIATNQHGSIIQAFIYSRRPKASFNEKYRNRVNIKSERSDHVGKYDQSPLNNGWEIFLVSSLESFIMCYATINGVFVEK